MSQQRDPGPTIRYIDWAAECRKEWGDEYYKPDVAYEFSNGRKFYDSGANSGVYNPLDE